MRQLGRGGMSAVYLAEDAPADQVAQLETALSQRTGGQARRGSPAEALGRLAQELGDQGRALTDLQHNPLPWTIEVKLPRAARRRVKLLSGE